MDVYYCKGFMDGTAEKRKAELKQVHAKDIFPWVKDGTILNVLYVGDSLRYGEYNR